MSTYDNQDRIECDGKLLDAAEAQLVCPDGVVDVSAVRRAAQLVEQAVLLGVIRRLRGSAVLPTTGRTAGRIAYLARQQHRQGLTDVLSQGSDGEDW